MATYAYKVYGRIQDSSAWNAGYQLISGLGFTAEFFTPHEVHLQELVGWYGMGIVTDWGSVINSILLSYKRLKEYITWVKKIHLKPLGIGTISHVHSSAITVILETSKLEILSWKEARFKLSRWYLQSKNWCIFGRSTSTIKTNRNNLRRLQSIRYETSWIKGCFGVCEWWHEKLDQQIPTCGVIVNTPWYLGVLAKDTIHFLWQNVQAIVCGLRGLYVACTVAGWEMTVDQIQ